MRDSFGKFIKVKPPLNAFYPLEKKPSRIKQCCEGCIKTSWSNCVRAYLSFRAFSLVLIAFLGPFIFYATYNILLMPGINTLKAGLRPTTCVVANAVEFNGKSNCIWTSCKMGCTDQELFICWNIYLLVDISLPNNSIQEGTVLTNYTNVLLNEETVILDWNSTFLNNSSININEDLNNNAPTLENLTKFYVNIEGCIYKSCSDWWTTYGQVGLAFTCFVSHNKAIAIPHVNETATSLQIIFGILPLILVIVSVLLIYAIYCRKGATDKTLNLTPDPEKTKEKWNKAKAEIIQNIMQQQRKKGNKKLNALKMKDILNKVKLDKKNKVSPKTITTAVYAIMDSKKINNRNKQKFKDYKGLYLAEKENKNAKGAKWRKLALKSQKVYPTTKPLHRFTEVDFDYTGRI